MKRGHSCVNQRGAMPFLLRMARFAQTFWSIIGISLLLFLIANKITERWIRPWLMRESLAAVIAKGLETTDTGIRDRFARESEVPLSQLDRRISSRWQPYVYWRSAPFEGELVRIDSTGLRRTLPTVNVTPDTIRIALFGGSTMWGYGARDEFTIASKLQGMLVAAGFNAQVVNYGQLAYVSTQELLTLITECQHQRVPEFVIFYDGFNDIFSALQNLTVGETIAESRRRQEFDVLSNIPLRTAALVYLRNTAVYQLFERSFSPFSIHVDELDLRWATYIDQRLQDPEVQKQVNAALASQPSADEYQRQQITTRIAFTGIIDAILDLYAENTATVSSVSSRVGCVPLFFWQPVINSKRELSAEEQACVDHEHPPEFVDFVYDRLVYRQKADGSAGPLANVHYLGEIFNNDLWRRKTAYIDAVHLTEQANVVIANALFEQLKAHLVLLR